MFAHILRPSLGKQRRNLHKSISPILQEKLANKTKQTSKQTIETETNKQIQQQTQKKKYISKQTKAENKESAKAWKMRDQFS